MLFAAHSIIESSKYRLKELFVPIAISIIIPNFIILLFFNMFVIKLNNIFDARYLITIGGMVLGNVLKGDIIGLMTYYNGIKDNYNKVNYDLALGASVFQATKPYLKKSIQVAIKPTISTAATMGIVSLPGMMTGQILGGSLPVDAIMYQIAIMIAIYVTRYSNILFAILLTKNKMFDKNDQLVLENFK
jgi:putative ABC transport system permease protein